MQNNQGRGKGLSYLREVTCVYKFRAVRVLSNPREGHDYELP